MRAGEVTCSDDPWMDYRQARNESLQRRTDILNCAVESVTRKTFESAKRVLDDLEDPRSASYAISLASMYTKLGRFEEAEKTYLAFQRTEAGKNDSMVYNLAGLFFEERGRYSEAVSQYEKAIQVFLRDQSPSKNIVCSDHTVSCLHAAIRRVNARSSDCKTKRMPFDIRACAKTLATDPNLMKAATHHCTCVLGHLYDRHSCAELDAMVKNSPDARGKALQEAEKGCEMAPELKKTLGRN